jgi:hypothetical protein
MGEPNVIASTDGFSVKVLAGTTAGRGQWDDRERITDNVKRAFEARGYDLHVSESIDWSSVALRRPSERRQWQLAASPGLQRAGLTPSRSSCCRT